MSIFFYTFYAIALLIILGGGVLVYRWVGRRNRLFGVLAGLLSSGILVLIWPVPIHGGFTFFGEVLVDELYDEWRRVEAKQEERKDQRFMSALETRFAGALNVERVETQTGSWSTIILRNGESAWLDKQSGLVWSAPRTLTTTSVLASIDAGKTLCRQLKPGGYWALPTEAERYQFWRANGRTHLPHKVSPAMAVIVDENKGIELPSVSLPAKRSGNNSTPGTTQLMIRCVARGPDAPLRGYIRSDIPLSEWNRYQLAKVSGE